jgi:hypothetical protein
MKHYICTGECGGMSEKPQKCMAEYCSMYGKPFAECNCEDGKHGGIVSKCLHCGKLCGLGGKCEVEPYKPELN